jgi:uroporphyrinogen-III synthase
MATPSFDNRRVLSFESRRAREIEALIATYGGIPTVAPAIRELPLDSDTDVRTLGDGIIRNDFDVVVFLTGVGARALGDTMGRAGQHVAFVEALSRVRVAVRGPKPAAVLREWQVPVWVNAPEPNTWRELLGAMDARADNFSIEGRRVAVQEYGVSNPELLEALRARGARVTAAPTYQWAMPENVQPLRDAVAAVVQGDVHVLVITSGIQIVNFLKIARELGLESEVKAALSNVMIASIGPSASAELRKQGLEPAFEPSHPKMGMLIREAAERQ